MAKNYYEEYGKAESEDRWTAAGEGAISGAGTGASIGTIINPGLGTVIGGAAGAIAGGAYGYANAKKDLTPYEIENLKKLSELEKRMEEGTLGLSEQEKQLLYDSAGEREAIAREMARKDQDRRTASMSVGSGTAFAEQALAEELAVEEARKTGLQVGMADLQKAQQEESEYWSRLAAMSLREAQEDEKSEAGKQRLADQFSEFITSETTEAGPGETKTSDKDMANQFNMDSAELSSAVKILADNPELLQMLQGLF